MPLSTDLLTWETAATFVLHGLVPLVLGLSFGLSSTPINVVKNATPLLIFAIPFVIVSFLAHMGLYVALQANACSGVRNWAGILGGAGIAAAITVVFAVLPVPFQWLRLLISQVFITHEPLKDLRLAAMEDVTLDAAEKLGKLAQGSSDSPEAVEPIKPRVPTEEEALDKFNRQTLKEIIAACSYMSAFGAAIGFAAGVPAGKVTVCRPAAASPTS